MPSKIRLFLTVPPHLLSKAGKSPFPLIPLTYHVGQDGQLHRSGPRLILPGGLMGLQSSGSRIHGSPAAFCQELLEELSACRFSGLFCRFFGPSIPFLQSVLEILSYQCPRRQLRLWVTESLAPLAPHGEPVISSALSGGTLTWRLEEAAAQLPHPPPILFLERTAMDFPLPAPLGRGLPLSPEALEEIRTRHSPALFFSKALCAQYFLYQTEGGSHRFVLFDNTASFQKKLQIARSLGVTTAVADYPQVGDWLDQILRWEEISPPSS